MSDVYVRTGSLDDELRVTVDGIVAASNVLTADGIERSEWPERLRTVLLDHDFVRARHASESDLTDLADRLVALARLVVTLPTAELADAVEALNHQLAAAAVAPSLQAHDGYPLHIHWTAPSTPFAHQVVVDGLMAIGQTLCDHGVERFGRCAAEGCERVFHDASKNRSRRFCDDARCASRTHTAAHRARQAADP